MPTLPSEGYSKEAYLSAGEDHIGEVSTGGIVVDVTPVCQAAAYTAADVLFDTTAITGAVRVSGGKVVLDSVVLLDEDDNAPAVIRLFFLRSNVALGTLNEAISISDANAREIQGCVSFATTDFYDLIGSHVACKGNLGLVLQPTTGTTLYVAGQCAGTPTQTASGIKLRLGFRYL